jgi:hypothetical protein
MSTVRIIQFIYFFFLDLVLMQQTVTLFMVLGYFYSIMPFYLLVKFCGPELSAARTHRRILTCLR